MWSVGGVLWASLIKKMALEKRKACTACEVLSYTFPKLYEGKSVFVGFYQVDPLSGEKRRKKYSLDHIKNRRERNAYAAQLISALVAKLSAGWNVWVTQNAASQYGSFDVAKGVYMSVIKKRVEKNILAKSSLENYTTYFNCFSAWLESKKVPLHFVYQLDRSVCSDFLDYLLLERDVSARTHNNYATWLSSFCEWLVGKGALESSPMTGWKKLKEGDKFREQLSPAMLSQLRAHLAEHDKHFLLACMLEYYTFIRPEELCSVKIGDISVAEQRIRLHGQFTKNRKDGVVGLNEEVIRLMVDLDVFNHLSSEYLFGSREFFPGFKKQPGRIFRERFQKLRKTLGWPECYQFYSLKDTGIRDLANAEGIVVARDQARHSDISTTNKYLKGAAETVHEETKHFKGGL